MIESSTTPSPAGSSSGAFQLCFRSLKNGRDFSFHCDATGEVDLDRMSDQMRNDYFYARGMRGRELSYPAVKAAGLH